MLASKSTFALLALLAPLGLQVASVAVDTRPIVTVTSIIPGGKGPMYAIEQGHKFAVFKAAGIMQAIEMKYAVNEGDDPEKQFTLIEWTDTEVRKVDAAPASNATFRVSTELEGPKSNPRPGATVKDQTFEFKAESKSYMLPCDAHNGVAMVCGDAFEEQSDCQPGTW